MAAVLETADKLIGYESRIPDLVDAARRRVNSRVTSAVFGVAGFLCLAVVAGAGLGERSRWWLLLAIPLLLWTAGAALGEHRVARQGHRIRLASSVAALAVVVLFAVVVAGVLSRWWLVPVVLAGLVAFGVWFSAVDSAEHAQDGDA